MKILSLCILGIEVLFSIYGVGFEGTTVQETATKYRMSGTIRKTDSTTVEITELPIKTWTQTYKELLESWVAGTEKTPAWIKDYKEYHTDSKVDEYPLMTRSISLSI